MSSPLLRIPYTAPLPKPRVFPVSADTLPGAVAALASFIKSGTVVLTGAGISVASGLADYRGQNGTYTLNKTYRPIYFNEFTAKHESRRRYWARSFLGWHVLQGARPNDAHYAVGTLGKMGLVRSVITQNVDSLHPTAHPDLKTLELHGYLRNVVCLTCGSQHPRDEHQKKLSKLNPAWDELLQSAIASGALSTEHPEERRRLGIHTNPDGDVDLPNASYTTFRYPACETCLQKRPSDVHIDAEGAWLPISTAGVLKPAVIFFGESVSAAVKSQAETEIENASRVLIVGSSVATYSAWRLVKLARDGNLPIGILNLGGVRNEPELAIEQHGVRIELEAAPVLKGVVQSLKHS